MYCLFGFRLAVSKEYLPMMVAAETAVKHATLLVGRSLAVVVGNIAKVVNIVDIAVFSHNSPSLDTATTAATTETPALQNFD